MKCLQSIEMATHQPCKMSVVSDPPEDALHVAADRTFLHFQDCDQLFFINLSMPLLLRHLLDNHILSCDSMLITSVFSIYINIFMVHYINLSFKFLWLDLSQKIFSFFLQHQCSKVFLH